MDAAKDVDLKSAQTLAHKHEINVVIVNNYCGKLFSELEIVGNGKKSIADLKTLYKSDALHVMTAIENVSQRVKSKGKVGISTINANRPAPLIVIKDQLAHYHQLALNSLAETSHRVANSNLYNDLNPVEAEQDDPLFIHPNAENKMLIITYQDNEDHLAFDGGFLQHY